MLPPAVRRVGEEASDDRVTAMVKVLAKALAQPEVTATSAVFVNEGDVSNVKEAERTGREGHNEYKAASQVLQPAFHVYATSRNTGKVVSAALWRAAAEEQGLKHGTWWMDAQADRRAERAAKRAEHHVKVLRWIERTPKIRALMPRGALDGFRAAEAAGTTMDVGTGSAKPSLSRGDSRQKPKMRTAANDARLAAARAAAPPAAEEAAPVDERA